MHTLTGIGLVMMGLCLLITGANAAIECYSCSGTASSDPDCFNNPEKGKTKTISDSQAACDSCSVTKTYVNNDVTLVERSCVLGCQPIDLPFKGSGHKRVCCATNLCNHTGKLRSSMPCFWSSILLLFVCLYFY